MTRSYALTKLLEHGSLTRQELREITGWTDKQLVSVLTYLSAFGKIESVERKWRLVENQLKARQIGFKSNKAKQGLSMPLGWLPGNESSLPNDWSIWRKSLEGDR